MQSRVDVHTCKGVTTLSELDNSYNISRLTRLNLSIGMSPDFIIYYSFSNSLPYVLANPISLCYSWNRNYVPPWELMSSFPEEPPAGLVKLGRCTSAELHLYCAIRIRIRFSTNTLGQTVPSIQIQLASEGHPSTRLKLATVRSF